MRPIISSVVLVAALAGCRDTATADRLAALETEMAQVRADAEAERLALQERIDVLQDRLDGFDPSEGAAIASDVADIQTALDDQASAADTRLTALEQGQTQQDGRLDALETQSASVDASLQTLAAELQSDYVTTASLDGVLRVTDLAPDYDDLPTLVQDVVDARSRLDAVEADGVSGDELDAVADALDDVQTALTDLDGEVDGVIADTQSLDARLGVQEDSAVALGNELDGLTSDLGTLQGTVSGVQTALTAESDARIQAQSELGASIDGLGTDLTGLQGDLAVVQSDVTGLQGTLSGVQSDVSSLQGTLSGVQSDVTGLQGDVSGVQSDVTGLQGTLSGVQSDVSTLEADLASSQTVLSGVQTDVSDLSASVSGILGDYLTSSDFSALSDEISDAAVLELLDEPVPVLFSCNASRNVLDVNVASVPDDATALVTNIYTYHSGRNDHVNHHFGRAVAPGTTWDLVPFDADLRIADVSVTHQGNSAGTYYYGAHFGSSVIPLKANGTFDASLCRGYSSGTHYVVLQVNGYYR